MLCDAMGGSRSSYYEWLNVKPGKREVENECLREKIAQAFDDSRGTCFDNATAESFFGTLKTKPIRGLKFPAREAGVAALFEYVEMFYNRVRLHSSLGYPIRLPCM